LLPEATAAQSREEDVLVAPHHALRCARGPAGVEDVEVVARSRKRRPLRARCLLRVFVRCGVAEVGVATVLEHDDVTEPRELGLDLADQGQERTLDDDRLDVGVLEDVAQLVSDVAIVDVDRDEPGLERAEEGLDPLGTVPAVDRHLRTGFETQTEHVVGDAVRALVELRERPARRARHERLAVRHRVDDDLEEISEVERRRPVCRRHASIRLLSRCVVSIHSSTISKMTSFVGRTVFSRPTIWPTGKPESSLRWTRETRRAA
jgi:hypothetical protein